MVIPQPETSRNNILNKKFTKEYTKILLFIASHESSIAFEQSLIYLQVMQDALDEATDSWGVKVTWKTSTPDENEDSTVFRDWGP